jgi:hypothetical protein
MYTQFIILRSGAIVVRRVGMDKPEPWSEAEQQMLRTLYSDRTLPISEIAAKLGRSSEAIGKQA